MSFRSRWQRVVTYEDKTMKLYSLGWYLCICLAVICFGGLNAGCSGPDEGGANVESGDSGSAEGGQAEESGEAAGGAADDAGATDDGGSGDSDGTADDDPSEG